MDDSVIHIDMTEALMDLPVRTLVRLANSALNTMDARTMAGVAFSAGCMLNIEIVPKEQDNG